MLDELTLEKIQEDVDRTEEDEREEYEKLQAESNYEIYDQNNE
jgi:hypothetical protein